MPFIDTTPIIENTTMRKRIDSDGNETHYCIKPIDGYVMHDKIMDDNEYDNEGNIVRLIALGYRRSEASVAINYDFEANSREFYTLEGDEERYE